MKRFKTHKVFSVLFALVAILGAALIFICWGQDGSIANVLMEKNDILKNLINWLRAPHQAIFWIVGVSMLLSFFSSWLAFGRARKIFKKLRAGRNTATSMHMASAADLKRIQKEKRKAEHKAKKHEYEMKKEAERKAREAAKQAAAAPVEHKETTSKPASIDDLLK